MWSLSAAYVLAGGRSTRMGRDKALLPWPEPDSQFLVQRVASLAAKAAGSATLVGDPARYGDLGFAVIPDLHPGLGPLSGVEAALEHTRAEWNLVIACDLPNVTVELLTDLLDRKAVVVAESDGLPAICAVLSRRCLMDVRAAIAGKKLSWHRFMDTVEAKRISAASAQMLTNLNSPKDLATHE